MSIRTHAPYCAKTRALIESEEDSTERRHAECTCGATYEPGVEARAEELEVARLAWANVATSAARLHEAVTVASGWLAVKEPLIAHKVLTDALAREESGA